MSIRSPRSGRSMVVAVLSLYPLLVMAPVLSPGTRSHLRNRFADPQLVTDFDGGIRLAYLLRSVTWPWSRSPLSGFPDGESLLRVQAVSQGIQLVAIHVLTRVFQPVLSMNLVVLGGWIVTGLAVYGLARRLGLERWWAVAAGVLAQLLPSMPTMGANFTSYIYVGVPVYVVSRAIDMASAPSRRNLVWMCGALGATLFFDPYWFFFSLAACLVALAVDGRVVLGWVRSEERWMQLVAMALCLLPVLMVTAMLSIGSSSSPGASSRPIAVETARFVDAGLRAPADWLRSGSEGLGVVIAVVALVSLLAITWRRREPRLTAAAAVVVTMVVLSTRTRVELPWLTVGSAAEYVRFVMPGVRFFQRAALIAEAMLCVFAVIGVKAVVDAAARWRPVAPARRGAALAMTGVLAIVAVVELEPYSRAYTHRWDDFAAMRAVLDEVPEPVLVALPFGRHGRGWLELSMFEDVPAVNQMYSRAREDLITVVASRGPVELAQYLASLGVTHVLAMTGDARFPTAYEFDAPHFVRRTSLMLDGYGEPDEEVALYELRPGPVSPSAAEPVCAAVCEMGDGFDYLGDPILLNDPGVDDDVIEVDGDATSVFWAVGTEVRVQLPVLGLPTLDYDGVASMVLTNPCPTPRDVSWDIDGTRRTVELQGGDEVTVTFPVSSTRPDELLTVTNDGDSCPLGPAGREVRLRMSAPVQTPVGTEVWVASPA